MIRRLALLVGGIAVGAAGVWLLLETEEWALEAVVIVMVSIGLMRRAYAPPGPVEPRPELTPREEWLSALRDEIPRLVCLLLLIFLPAFWSELREWIPLLPPTAPTEEDRWVVARWVLAALWGYEALWRLVHVGRLRTQAAAEPLPASRQNALTPPA